MVSTSYSYQNRASSNLRNSGIFLLIAGSISFIVNIISFWFYFSWIGWMREIFGIIALILLIVAIGSMKLLLPQDSEEIETCRRWLVIWVALDFVWSFGYLIHPFVSISFLVLAVIARIFALIKLNIIFQIFSDTYSVQGKFDSWIFPLYGFYGIVTIVPSLFTAMEIAGYYGLSTLALIIIGFVVSAINFLLLLGVGIMLLQNSQKLLMITLRAIPGVPYAPQVPYETGIQSGPTKKPKPTRKFCENCGAKINFEEKFCQNCGYNLG